MLTIHVLGDHSALQLAGEDLKRCLTIMSKVEVAVASAPEMTGEAGIWLGTAEHLPREASPPDVADRVWNDAFCVRSVGEAFVIGGSNPRSVLMGVYEYLRELGAEWTFPGADGEVLPSVEEVPLSGFDLERTPPNRHRGVCIEGAPSLEHVLDMVEWMPRVGCHAYSSLSAPRAMTCRSPGTTGSLSICGRYGTGVTVTTHSASTTTSCGPAWATCCLSISRL